MPNGVSCAVFAVKNHIYGTQEKNLFREGIAGIQTVRAADAVAQTATVQKSVFAPTSKFLGKAANIGRKLVYPLIVASGVYNTVKSDDKVKTGVSQASGIASMYTFEKVAEKTFKKVMPKINNIKCVKNNKWAKVGVYSLKGLCYVGASLLGYDLGCKSASKIVDEIRYKKDLKDISSSKQEDDKYTSSDTFEEMKL